MSTQMTDDVNYRGKRFTLVNARGCGLFAPWRHGIRLEYFELPEACLRGYVCEYELTEGRLFLTRVSLWLSRRDEARADSGKGPLLFGKVPERQPRRMHSWSPETHKWIESIVPSDDFMVEGIREPIRFTGRFTLGADFIREMYEVGAIHQAEYKYRTVYDMTLKAGLVTGEYDRSEKMVAYRQRLIDRKSANERLAMRIKDWINRFSI